MPTPSPLRQVPPVKTAPEVAPITVLPTADMLVFDTAPVFSNANGQVSLTLSARRFVPDTKGGVQEQDVVVGFLRCSSVAAQSLRSAIDGALLLGRPAKSATSN